MQAGSIKYYSATTVLSKIKSFHEFCKIDQLYKVNTADIQEFIDHDYKQHPSNNRKNKTRQQLSRFFSWASVKGWGVSNPITGLAKLRKARKNIKWHPHKKIKEILFSLNDYWQPIFALLSMQGLNPNEIAGIKTEDVIKTDDGYEIYITTWKTDNFEKSQKTNNRQSGLKVFKSIIPLISTFIEKEYTGKDIFFAVPEGKGGPRPKSNTPKEMWRPQQLSLEVNKLLPENILVQDLRRCAANFMLKELKLSIEQVAGILRNTPQTVWESYARFLPGDVIQDD